MPPEADAAGLAPEGGAPPLEGAAGVVLTLVGIGAAGYERLRQRKSRM
jgi:hypothetical protein